MALPLVIVPLLTTIGAFVGRFLTDNLLKFAAYKLLLFTLITVIFPVVVKNLLTWLFNTLTSFVDTIDLGDIESSVLQLTGLAAYLAQHLNLVDAVTIILTALVIRFTLNLIPFIG